MDKTGSKKHISLAMVTTLLTMYLITGAALFLLAFFLYKFRLDERFVTISILAVYVASCVIGGLIAGRRMKNRRFFWGLMAGILYFGILAAGSFFLNKGVPHDMIHTVTAFLLCAAAGMIGGMIS